MQQWSRRAPHLYTPEQRHDVRHEGGSSSASLTQEQMLAEVQKQVRLEMKSHEQQRKVLAEENQQLKGMLERLMVQVQHQTTDGRGAEGDRGTSSRPQGAVSSSNGGEGRGGNVDGLRPPPEGAGGNPYKAQPGGGVGERDGVFRGNPQGVCEGRADSGGDPLGVLGGIRSRTEPLQGAGSGDARPTAQGEGVPSAPYGVRSDDPASVSRGPLSYQDPIGTLVQGMAQLQTMSESLTTKSKEPEVVKPGLSELPKLAAELSGNSAIDVGDWLHGLQNHMGDLSNNSGQWWAEVLQCLTRYYDAYLKASHVDKLTLKAEDYETELLKDTRWARVDKRASSMILSSLPSKVKDEVLSLRLVGTLPTLCRVMVLYRPGSLAEQILKALEHPTTSSTASEAVDELRKWGRWMGRASDLGVQSPDPSILIRGLDAIVKKVLPENPDIAFRVSMLRYTLEVDTRPTEKGARDLQQALMSELEQIAYRSRPASSGTPFVKAATAASPAPSSKATSEATPSVPQPKPKAKTPCRFYLTDKGCSKGSACTFSHNCTRKERLGRCWSCGSTQHQQQDCPTKSGGSSPVKQGTSQAQTALAQVTVEPKAPPSSSTSTTTHVLAEQQWNCASDPYGTS